MKKLQVLFIVNPASAGGKTKQRFKEISKKINKELIDETIFYTKKSGCAMDYAKKAALDGNFDVIVSVGGDGTANEIINGLINSEVPYESLPAFTILPSGTGSDSVRTLGIPKEIESFFEIVVANKTQSIDVGVAKFTLVNNEMKQRYFLNACDLGIGATVAHAVNSMNQDREKKSGKSKYFRSIMKQVFKFKTFDATYVMNGESFEIKKTVIVAICNGMFFGGGVKVSPLSKMNDSSIELLATTNLSKSALLGVVSKVYSGAHLGHKKVIFKQATTFTVIPDKPQLLETDGEVAGLVKEASFNLIEAPLKVLF